MLFLNVDDIMELIDIKNAIEQQISDDLNRCGLMYRIFGRVKTTRSLEHKMAWKGDQYRNSGKKIQDVIGLRIVLYYPDDVELLGFFFSCKDIVDSAVDAPGVDTFRPQRLNLVKPIPQHLVDDFRKHLPEQYAPYIDATYEVQIRTIFSEGWHEVEHDMRYKCKEDWEGYENYSRTLNGVIATLETAEWSMSSIFQQMARVNLEKGEYRSMLRNKMLVRIADNDFSPRIYDYLINHKEVAEALFNCDRMVFLITLLSHKGNIPLTYDNILFLSNRFDMMYEDVLRLEDEETKSIIDKFINS